MVLSLLSVMRFGFAKIYYDLELFEFLHFPDFAFHFNIWHQCAMNSSVASLIEAEQRTKAEALHVKKKIESDISWLILEDPAHHCIILIIENGTDKHGLSCEDHPNHCLK